MEVLRRKASMVGLAVNALMAGASMESLDGRLRWRKASMEGFLGSALAVGLDGNVSMEGLEARLRRRDPGGPVAAFDGRPRGECSEGKDCPGGTSMEGLDGSALTKGISEEIRWTASIDGSR